MERGALGFLLLLAAGVFILLYGMWLRARRNERLASLYEKALDKGIDPRSISLELDEREAGDPQGNLKAGIILLATALSMVLGIWAAQALFGAWRLIGFALVPGGIGLACLFIHYSLRSSTPRISHDPSGKDAAHSS
jgi:hypothetical protein